MELPHTNTGACQHEVSSGTFSSHSPSVCIVNDHTFCFIIGGKLFKERNRWTALIVSLSPKIKPILFPHTV